MLRFDAPTTHLARFALEPVEIQGHSLAAGDLLQVCVGSVNRDPRVYPDPDRLDLSRQPRELLSFGLGPHFCLGASLARAEMQEALECIIERLPKLSRPSGPLQLREGVGRSLVRLELTVE